MTIRRRLVRDLRSGARLDLFFVSAVASVLLIRFYLRLTGYPSVGGATLHVAHVLWGGLLMLAALILLLAYLGRTSRRWAALLCGIGFCTFIDEVGKFVTRDNDYFYRPAVALIYVFFVLAYVAMRSIHRRRVPAGEEYVVNALQELEEAAMHDLQREERERALQYLARASPGDRLAEGLTALIRGLHEAPSRAPGRVERVTAELLHRYRRLARRPAFWQALVLFFIGQVLLKLLHVGILVFYPEAGGSLPARLAFMSRRIDDYALPEWLQLGSSLLSALFVGAGIVALRRSRQSALRLFQRSILISVFVTQVFMFYRSQWDALVVLAFNLLVLLALGYMRSHEQQETV
ncbi:hypothetical protein BH24GEM1_BH24GEM1_20770 [soil metagenome]